MGDLRLEAFHMILLTWVKANEKIGLSLAPEWTKACGYWMWFEQRSQG